MRREYRGLLALQEEVAQTIARQVGASATPIAARSHSTNPDAYQAYRQYFLRRGGEKGDFDKALVYAGQAIELNGNYSPAWALRSLASEMAGEGFIDVDEGFRRAREDASTPLLWNPNSAAAYVSLASIHLNYNLDWEAAKASLDKAAELQPASAELLGYRSNVQEMLGDLDEAVELQRQAIALDPLRIAFMHTWGTCFTKSDDTEKPKLCSARPWS